MTPRSRNRTTVRRLAALSAGAALTLGVGACTSDDDTEKSNSSTSEDNGSASSSGSGDQDAPGKDQSAELFDAYSEPKPTGKSTKGDWSLEIFEVRSTANGTRLTFRATGPGGTHHLRGQYWAEQPVITDTSAKVGYQPLTVVRPGTSQGEGTWICVCAGIDVNRKPHVQDTLYETLPKDVTTVDITFRDLDPVTVKVAR